MRITRLVLIVVLLGAVTSSSFAQLLPRRREATRKAIEEAVMVDAAKWAGEVLGKEIGKALDKLMEKVGHFLELRESIQLFAEIQMDPQAKKRIDNATDRDSRELKELMDTGSTRVFLSETAKFAEKLRNEKFSPPVLEKIYLVCECDGDGRFMDDVRKDDQFSSWTIHMGDFLERDSYRPSATTARVLVTLPADADLWFNGVRMKTAGPSRRFETPDLGGSGVYTYEARARWMENGQEKTQTQKVAVSPGAIVRIAFPARPNEGRDRRAVTCFESHRPKDPKNKIPLTAHCSLVFKTQRESKGFQRSLSFDLYLEKLKKEEGAKSGYPWKVKNVQYK
jgi:uncharacterized protein (TIGR03000 family)